MKEYLYIVQSSIEISKCKIGITNDLERRLKEHNSITGTSAENTYEYLFTCEVSDMRQIEQDIKDKFLQLRELGKREIYFYNPSLFDMYVDFIISHPLYKCKVSLKQSKSNKNIKAVTTPSMSERGIDRINIINKAKKVKYDEFYTRLEDIEKEMVNYPTKIWKDKCIFCNCDDALGDSRNDIDSSAFALYFLKNFFQLKLKKLICTHYGSKVDLFNAGVKGYIFTKEGAQEMKYTPPRYTGGFDEPESLRILMRRLILSALIRPFLVR